MALAVAADGELAEPRIPSPPSLRAIMGFSRLSARSYETIVKAVDDDDAFRQRVAAFVEDEAKVGRAGWLWLHRPEGWLDDPVFAAPAGPGPAADLEPLRRERDRANEAASRHRAAAAESEARRRRAEERAAELRTTLDAVRTELETARAEVARLTDDRGSAIRAQKALETEVQGLRRDLRVARRALQEVEAELLEVRVATNAAAEMTGSPVAPNPAATGPGAGDAPPVPPPPGSGPVGFDQAGAQAAVAAAAEAARTLADALADAGRALGGAPGERSTVDEGDEPAGGAGSTSPAEGDRPGSTAHRGERRRGRERRRGERRPGRRPPPLPPGVFDGSPEAIRHLVTGADAHVVVDGYNLARSAWTGVEPEEERRRTVALLEEVAARSGNPVTVVFDGDDDMVAPVASRAVHVIFSATGVTADDTIGDLLRAWPDDQAVLVVSSDREVATDARTQGAAVISSADFLTAAGR